MWIEIAEMGEYIPIEESRPARALWIEILILIINFLHGMVEAREGLVD